MRMLHRYSFSNFQSFREKTEVSWLLDRKVPTSAWSSHAETGERISSVMAVLGANASGKTALLKPILFVNWFLSQSFEMKPTALLPFQPHAMDINEPSEFQVDADFDGKLWIYKLRCTPQRVLHESLHVKNERTRYVFVRDWNEVNQSYDIKQQDFGLLQSEARKVRPNASLIATAAQYGVPLALKLTSNIVMSNTHAFGRRINDLNHMEQAITFFARNADQLHYLIALLSAWDLGLMGLELREQETVTSAGITEKYWTPIGIHKGANGANFEVPFPMQSSGTKGAIVLLYHLLPVLQAGGLAVIDEFESDLHPHMIEPILNLFANPSSNPLGAQLLFTSHAIEVLNIVQKSQVMLVEKNEFNESSAWRLDSVAGIRSDDNFYAKYMAGAYGAVPQL